jgi:hypothetical protein
MTLLRRVEVGILVVLMLALVTGAVVFRHWQTHRLRSLQGAIVMLDPDAHKEIPVANADVTATIGRNTESVKSDSSGFFKINVRPGTRRGQPMTFEFQHPDYRPLVVQDYVGDQLYVAHMVPRLAAMPADEHRPVTKISNVTVRYSFKTVTRANIGSTVKTFQVENQGNVPCKNQSPCSPDGRWKATTGSTSVDAGAGNEFQDVRVSCIAGPCPFTHIEPNHVSRDGQILSVSARDWSDTTTFLIEAEVLHPMPTEIGHEFYPVIFGKGMSFTLPAAVEAVTIEADVDNQDIFFPFGPALSLSWASCNQTVNPDQTKIYRCELKPGYRFQ